MDVIGIDPSFSCTGVAKVVDGIVLTARIRSTPGNNLQTVDSAVRYLVGGVLKFAPAEVLTVIEATAIVRNGRGGLQVERAWLFGMLVTYLLRRGPVIQVRTKTRAKYACGNGNAQKPEVLAAVRATHPSLSIPDDNVADALALLGMGARHLGAPIDGAITSKQAAAMNAVEWTTTKGTRS